MGAKRLCLVILFCAIDLFSFDIGTHWYISLQTADIWQSYDPAFYQLIDPSRTDIWAVRARKFYFIGLALPDILDQQEGIRSFANSLYALKGELIEPAYRSAIDIYDNTKSQVQTTITFNGPPPNANLTKLKQMADWVKTNVSNVEDRAVVYGALMHVIQDLYAHMNLESSRFGYGRVIQPNGTPVEEPIFVGEPYYEMFVPTYVPSWDFVKNDIYRSFDVPYSGGQLRLVTPGTYCADFWRVWNVNLGQLETNFQESNFLPIQRFVDAANAVGYGTSSLTRERLEAYIHVAGIALFTLYGYERGGGNVGGVAGHPNWTFAQVADFVRKIGEGQWQILNMPEIYKLTNTIKTECAVTFVLKILKYYPEVYGVHLHEGPWIDVLLNIIGTNPWYTYLETPAGIDQLWAAIPNQFKPQYQDQYELLRSTISQWNQGEIKKPNLRTSYSEEISQAIAIREFYRQSLLQGSSYFDYEMNNTNVYQILRKQGPLGGLFTVYDTTYFRQPSILNMYFKLGSTPVWTEIEAPYSGLTATLSYDLFKYGKSKIRIWGKGVDGATPPNNCLAEKELLGGPARESGTLDFDASAAANANVREVSFRAETWSNSHGNYWCMMNSDYRGMVDFHTPPYSYWFNWGRPTRCIDENPLTEPLHYWPYVLRMTSLKKPTALNYNEMFATNQVKLRWTDNSKFEDGFKIARRRDDQQWNSSTENYASVDYSPDSGGTKEYIDTVSFLRKYVYKIRAYDNQGRVSDWSDSVVFVSGAIAQSNYSRMSAFNNGAKVLRYRITLKNQHFWAGGKC
ncbi:MAG: hypothetical protein ABIL40_10085 [candidate division WOR-3 bacterium]